MGYEEKCGESSMKTGDLIQDKNYHGPVAIVLTIKDRRTKTPYQVLCSDGNIIWFDKEYIENDCEVICEKR